MIMCIAFIFRIVTLMTKRCCCLNFIYDYFPLRVILNAQLGADSSYHKLVSKKTIQGGIAGELILLIAYNMV